MISKNARRKLYEYVIDELGLQIVRGDYLPGETLPNEDALCKQFNVSRGVLREATKVLIQKGLIQARTKTGTVVCPRNSWNVFDPDVLIWKYQSGNTWEFLENILEVRRIIEAEASRLAAKRASDEDIARIQSIYQTMVTALNTENSHADDELIAIDLQFHAAILDACRNELLAQIGHTMRQAFLTARQNDRHDVEAQKNSLPSHLAILNAIINHDSEEAYRAAQEHITTVWHDMRHALDDERE